MSVVKAIDGDPLAALTSSFASPEFEVTKSGPDSILRDHPRFALYKCRSFKKSNQDQRREVLLEHQKNRRTNAIEVARALVTGVDLEEDSDADEHDDTMDVDSVVKRIQVRRSYKKQLMMSEWMVNVPKDLSSQWIVVPVPEGRRNLVVAGNGSTRRYSRHGHYLGHFKSVLSNRKKLKETILDTIFDPTCGTFFILDVMVYDGSSCYDCDTEFRFKWQIGKMFEDLPSLQMRGRNNCYEFKPLLHHPADKRSLQNILSDPHGFCFSPSKVDGLLFYHSKLHYMPGHSPLVNWLKAYMIPEILDVPVSSKLMDQRPADYMGVSTEIAKFEDDYEKKRGNRRALEKMAT